MRTTIRLDDELLKELKLQALQSGKSLTAVIEDALRQSLNTRQQSSEHKSIRLKTVSGKGLQAGVDLDDFASLLELMEKRDDSA